jgi:hypothetical protein
VAEVVEVVVMQLVDAIYLVQQDQSAWDWGNVTTTVAAFAAVASAVAAIVISRTTVKAMRVQDRRAQLTLADNLTQQLADKYDSPEMRATRRGAAECLLQATENGRLFPNNIDDEDLVATLNFLENIGTLVRWDVLEEHLVWTTFFPSVPMYWHAAALLIQHWRTGLKRPMYFEDLEHLSQKLVDYENKQLARRNLPPRHSPSSQEARNFMKGEAEL